jgi:hypothetical protein
VTGEIARMINVNYFCLFTITSKAPSSDRADRDHWMRFDPRFQPFELLSGPRLTRSSGRHSA